MSTATAPIYVVRLTDGVEYNRRYPVNFEIPSDQAKATVKVGDTVKIKLEWQRGFHVPAPDCIADGRQQMIYGEGFWVRVTHRSAHSFLGCIANEMVFVAVHGFVFADEIAFHSKHILSIIKQ
jgi:hypothetical protein